MSEKVIDGIEELYENRHRDIEFESITVIEGKPISSGEWEQVDSEYGVPIEQPSDEPGMQWPLLWEERSNGTFEMVWQLHAVGGANVGTFVFVSPHFAEPFSQEDLALRELNPRGMSLRFDRISDYETVKLDL